MSCAVQAKAGEEPSSRILLLAPTGRDAALMSQALCAAGIDSYICADVSALCEQLSNGAAAAVITEEAVNAASLKALAQAIEQQPTWSDFPLIVITDGGESTPRNDLKFAALSPLGNVVVIERPLRPATLTSLIKTAMRARERQYQVRELLASLRVTEERLRTMIESAQDYAIVSLDNSGCVTYWNSGAQRVLGYADHEVIGKPVEMIFTHDDRMAGVPAHELRTAAALGRSETEGWRIRKDGSMFWASGVVTPIGNASASGAPSGFLKVLRDMTAHRRAAERLALQAKQLEQSNEDLQRFAYVASHDLQEPLRMVASYSQLLAYRNEGILDEDSRVFLNYILSGADRMRRLIQDLLEFSRLSDQSAPAAPVDCNTILGLALQHLQLKISECGASVTFDRLPVVLAHDTRLLQVFQNLIGNALKYCETRPKVHIYGRSEGEFCVIAIRDNGIGIAPEHHERIFGLFRRLHTRDEYSGTGIGLATCKRIVEQEGGKIWVESEVGRGSTFYFTLRAAGD